MGLFTDTATEPEEVPVGSFTVVVVTGGLVVVEVVIVVVEVVVVDSEV